MVTVVKGGWGWGVYSIMINHTYVWVDVCITEGLELYFNYSCEFIWSQILSLCTLRPPSALILALILPGLCLQQSGLMEESCCLLCSKLIA